MSELTNTVIKPAHIVDNAPRLLLNNGIEIPQLGLGVWQAEDGEQVEQAVLSALDVGYRLIDTAAMYGNEAGVGRAIRKSGLPREDIFVTTKLWNDAHSHEAAIEAFDASLKKLNLDYIDLYLIHWPVPAQNLYVSAWKSLQTLQASGRVRAIGVCNFMPEQLQELIDQSNIVPAVNQIELHPRLKQLAVRDFCAQHGIRVESWSPLMQGSELLDDTSLQTIGAKYGKTAAQVILRWHLQHGLIIIPKSIHSERIKENYDILNFALDNVDMQTINAMDTGERVGPHPLTANFK